MLLGQALDRIFRDLASTGAPVPQTSASDWQTWEPSESAFLRSESGSGRGVWVDPSLPEAERVAMVADQVQQHVVEEMPAHHLPTNWPPCPEHPRTHPLEARVIGAIAVWACPLSGHPAYEIGRVSGRHRHTMSVVEVDERDSSWEDDLPRFRVYVQSGATYDGTEWTGGATSTYDVTGADVLQVVDWAQQQATAAGGRATYSVALVTRDDRGQRGLVWLVGVDGNDSADPGAPAHERQRRMLDRRDQPIVVPEADRARR